MKIENIIRRVLREEQEEEKLLKIPGFRFFNNDWNILQKFLESQGNPRYSIGDLSLSEAKIETLGNLVRVEGDLDLESCQNLESLENLEYVGGYLDLRGCKNLQSLGNLEYVGGWLDLKGTDIETLGNLNYVGDNLDLESCQNFESLGNLKSVAGYFNLRNCKNLQSLGDLKHVGSWLDLGDSNVESLGNLKYVGSDLYSVYVPLSKKYTEYDIRKMVKVVGNVYL